MSRGRSATRRMMFWRADQAKPTTNDTVVCWLRSGQWYAGWWCAEDGRWLDAATGGTLDGVVFWGEPPSPLPKPSPLFQRERWLRARELQQQGLSYLRIGLELDPPCSAAVVGRGLAALARRENEKGNRPA